MDNEKMTLYKGKYRVESTRLPDWDYASSGWYFVTICTKDRVCFFGEIVSGTMHRPESGEIAHRRWEEIPQRYAHVVLDAFVVMPNHIHGIIEICDDLRRDAPRRVSTGRFGPLQRGSLSSIVNHYKGAVTKEIRSTGCSDFAWQPRFHEHIIRNEKSLHAIRRYIFDNPARWDEDHLKV